MIRPNVHENKPSLDDVGYCTVWPGEYLHVFAAEPTLDFAQNNKVIFIIVIC